jgi:hypothetical protein
MMVSQIDIHRRILYHTATSERTDDTESSPMNCSIEPARNANEASINSVDTSNCF